MSLQEILTESGSSKRNRPRILFFSGSIIALALAFYLGFLAAQTYKPDETGYTQRGTLPPGKVLHMEDLGPKYLNKDVSFDLFLDVWRRAKNDFIVKNTPDTKLFYGALRGVVESLGDPYSEFFDPETAQKFDETISGTFEGIGAEIGVKNKALVIVAPLPGSPAEKAGLRPGDKILQIDKHTTTDMSVDYAVNAIRGKRGTKVTLTIYREGEKKEREVTIARQKIIVASVTSSMKDDGIGYIKISQFNQDTVEGFKKSMNDILTRKPKGLIIDMRNNPGGLLDAAVTVAGSWIDTSTVVIEKYGDSSEEKFKSRGKAKLKDVKTIVLVNEGSASAAEILAGALQDYGKATLVGKKTFGKGSVQNFQHLEDGSALKLTVAKWLTPKGRSIDETGIKPDVEVDMKDEDFAANKDPQLDKAIELLKK